MIIIGPSVESRITFHFKMFKAHFKVPSDVARSIAEILGIRKWMFLSLFFQACLVSRHRKQVEAGQQISL